jgi:hypothetical protein
MSVPESSLICMWDLAVSFSSDWMKLLVTQDSQFSDWFLRVFHLLGFGPWVSWSNVYFIAWLVPGFKVLS